jgi:K+-sensing histidine kinase KdpD
MRDLTDLSRIESGEVAPRLEPVRIENVIQAAYPAARRILRGGGDNIIALSDNMIRKWQIVGIGRGEIQTQVKSVSNLFGIAA